MIDLAKYSPGNKLLIKESLDILTSAVEVRDLRNKYALKIPIYNFTTKNHIDYQKALNILNLISQRGTLFIVLNEKQKRLLRESIPGSSRWQAKNEKLKKAYYQLNITEEDLKKYFLLEIKDSGILEKLNQEMILIDQTTNVQTKTKGRKPICKIKGQMGYVMVGKKQSKPFKELKSRQWKLIRKLVEFFEVARTDESI